MYLTFNDNVLYFSFKDCFNFILELFSKYQNKLL